MQKKRYFIVNTRKGPIYPMKMTESSIEWMKMKENGTILNADCRKNLFHSINSTFGCLNCQISIKLRLALTGYKPERHFFFTVSHIFFKRKGYVSGQIVFLLIDLLAKPVGTGLKRLTHHTQTLTCMCHFMFPIHALINICVRITLKWQ